MEPIRSFGTRGKTSPEMRIAWMVGMLLLIGGGIVYSLSYLDRENKKKLTSAEQVPQEKDDYAPPLAQDKPIELAPNLAAQIDDSTPIARTKIEREPHRELLSAVTNKTLRFLREVLGLEEADHDRLVEKPAAYRGKTVFVRGELVDFSERILEDPVGDYYRLSFGVIRDFSGKLFWFETFHYDDEHLFKVGQVAIAEGVFFKNFKYVRVPGTPFDLKDLPEQVDNLPMLICKSVKRSFRVTEVSAIDRDVMSKVRYDTAEEQQTLESEPLYHLIGYMKNLPPDEVPTKVASYPDMANRLLVPTVRDEYQGKWVKLWGRLGAIYKHIDEENPAGIQSHYRAYLWSSDRRLVSIFLPEKPTGFKLMEEIVEVTGIYFKPWRYKADSEDRREVRTPVIIAKTMKVKKFKESFWSKFATYLVMALTVAITLIVWIIYRDRRDMKKYGDAFIKRRRERRLKQGTPAIRPPEMPTPDATPDASP